MIILEVDSWSRIS